MTKDSDKIEQLLERIALALEARRPAPAESFDAQLKSADAFVWEAEGAQLVPVKRVAALPMVLLKGIDLGRQGLNGRQSLTEAGSHTLYGGEVGKAGGHLFGLCLVLPT